MTAAYECFCAGALLHFGFGIDSLSVPEEVVGLPPSTKVLAELLFSPTFTSPPTSQGLPSRLMVNAPVLATESISAGLAETKVAAQETVIAKTASMENI